MTRPIRRWLKPNYPYYFFKTKDVPDKYLVDAFQSQKHHIYDIVVGNRRAEAAATLYHDDELDGLIQIEFSEMDAWFEEDEQIYVHPKDPYKVCCRNLDPDRVKAQALTHHLNVILL